MLSIAVNIVVQAFGKIEHLLINFFTKKSKEQKEREEEKKKKRREGRKKDKKWLDMWNKKKCF